MLMNEKYEKQWEVIPYLHLGFAILNLIYLPLSFLLTNKLHSLLSNPQVSQILKEVYGTDFLFLFSQFGWLKWLSICFVVYTSAVNIWAFKVFQSDFTKKQARLIFWMNIGVPPWGTALAIVTRHLIRARASVEEIFN